MDDDEHHRPDKPDSPPAVVVQVRIGHRGLEWIVERQNGGFERQAVLGSVLPQPCPGPMSNAMPALRVATIMALHRIGVKGRTADGGKVARSRPFARPGGPFHSATANE